MKNKPYYSTCPFCGCNLDPGERCDCKKRQEERQEKPKKTLEAIIAELEREISAWK